MLRGIWGCGFGGKLLLELLRKQNINVDFFIDTYKSGKEEGLPIVKPQDIPPDAEILMSFHTIPYEVPNTVIKFFKNFFLTDKTLKQTYRNLLTLSEIFFKYPQIWPEFRDNYPIPALGKPIPSNVFKALLRLFDDDKSKKTLERIYLFRNTLSLDFYPYPETAEIQYFIRPVKEFFSKKNIHFLDLGSFKGETILILFSLFPAKVKTVIAVEPLLKNIPTINKVFKFLSKKEDFQGLLFPVGAWRETKKLAFSESESSSKLNEEGKETIPVAKFDELLHNININFIKMDIEGAELAALQGLDEIITRWKPVLALSVYHKPEDIWEIPFYLKSKYPWYKFYLRVHGHLLNEIVLYAIPY